MTAQVSDLHVATNVPLPPPVDLLAEIPRPGEAADFVAEIRSEIREIIFGADDRFLLVVGPCSIHDVAAGAEYAGRLAKIAAEVRDEILLVMRVYFEKPRTTIGWKGLIMDPTLDGSGDIPTGLRTARRFLLDVLALGVPTATELLDPITPQYIADLICWSAIGARTTESQTHRQMASGLSMPLGFKNATPGTLEPAVNAIRAAVAPQTFLGVSPEGVASAVTTRGNPDCHIIPRGGDTGPNFDAAHVAEAAAALAAAGLPQAIMVDASHANSAKDHRRQGTVFRDVVAQRCAGNSAIIGAMLESNLVAGSQSCPQPPTGLVYGQSITDACIGWEETESLIREAARALAATT
ncbi:3-deoxy-7-phosphoheptulonate synthase [soil metagenome]